VLTPLTRKLGMENPIFGFSRSPRVVEQVSLAGGMGVFAASSYTPEELDAQLTWLDRQVEGRPYGVDLLVPDGTVATEDRVAALRNQIPDEHFTFIEDLLAHFDVPSQGLREGLSKGEASARALSPEGVRDLLDVTFTHPISLVANALGPPSASLIDGAANAGIAVAALVGSAEHASRHISAGVDVLVAQGAEAGGHTGEISTMVLVPEVVAAADGLPVVAAGGIARGVQIVAALALGAQAVWCGSVWLASEEDIAPTWLKRKFLRATSHDTIRSRARTGKPARQLRTPWHDAWLEGPAALPIQQQLLLMKDTWSLIDASADAGNPGAQELGSFFIGQVVGCFERVRPTREIVSSMVAEAEQVREALSQP